MQYIEKYKYDLDSVINMFYSLFVFIIGLAMALQNDSATIPSVIADEQEQGGCEEDEQCLDGGYDSYENGGGVRSELQ